MIKSVLIFFAMHKLHLTFLFVYFKLIVHSKMLILSLFTYTYVILIFVCNICIALAMQSVFHDDGSKKTKLKTHYESG